MPCLSANIRMLKQIYENNNHTRGDQVTYRLTYEIKLKLTKIVKFLNEDQKIFLLYSII